MLLASRAPSTTKLYEAAYSAYSAFMSELDIPPVPASPIVVLCYLQSLRQRGLAAGSIATALYAISWFHKIAGEPSPADDFLCKSFLEGVRRSAPAAECRTVPATLEMIQALKIAATTSQRLIEFRAFVMAVFCFAGALRFSECQGLQFKHVRLTDSGLELFLAHSKTDQHKKGQVVELSATGSNCCPRANFTEYSTLLAPGKEVPDAFVFANLSNAKPVSKDNTIRTLRDMLKRQGVPNAQRITLHSFRIGCATRLIAHNVDSVDIRQLGRWKSNAAFDRYNRNTPGHKQAVVQALGL